MKSDKTTLVLPEGVTTLTLIEGVAPTPLALKEPKSITIDGDITTISNFVKIRRGEAKGIQQLNAETIIVEADKNGRVITMKLDPESHYSTTIIARLQQSEELKKFNINADRRYERKELLKLLKFGRHFFTNKQQYDSVIAGLSAVRMKTTAEIEQSSDTKGNRKSLDEVNTVMSEGFVSLFTLALPLFKGFTPENIEVEICFDVLNGQPSFWLESVGLSELLETKVDAIFELELDNVRDFVIIYK